MIESLLDLDRKITIFFNSFHSDFWDKIIYNLTDIEFWLPLFIVIAYLIYRKTKDFKQTIFWLFILGGVIFFTDMISARVLKPYFKRLRPCNDPIVSGSIHIVRDYCSRAYSFVSSHATNSFGLFSIACFFRKKLPSSVPTVLFFWSLFFSYTRIYLGVHFVGDVLGGFVLGFITAFLYYKLVGKIFLREG